jgi:hypothetical protein
VGVVVLSMNGCVEKDIAIYYFGSKRCFIFDGKNKKRSKLRIFFSRSLQLYFQTCFISHIKVSEWLSYIIKIS